MDEKLLNLTDDCHITRAKDVPGLKRDTVWFTIGDSDTLQFEGELQLGLILLKTYFDRISI